MTNPIDISPVHRKIICDILSEHLPSSVNVWVFGSRADWTTKNSSDLDLALEGESKMDYKIIRILEDEFEDSDLPYTVDIIDMNTINPKFKQIVSKQMIPLSIVNNANNTTGQWRKIQFGNCAKLIHDTTSPIDLADTPYVGLEHIGEGTLSLIGCGTAKDVTSAKTYFRSGDILFGKLRPYFRKVVHVDFNGICSTDIWVIRPTREINADFLFYIVASMEFVNFAMQGSIGTKMPRAKWEWVSRYNVNIPHVSKQQNIANILKALDNKIELNKRISQTLEEISRTLFKSWFVDFEPVRAKMDGHWKQGKSLPGLPAHFYDLFPDNMAGSGTGEIPKGWDKKSLDEIADFRNGLALQNYRPKENESRLPVVKIAQLRNGQVDNKEWAREDIIPECIICDGDVVFSWSGSLLVKIWCGGRAALNQHLFKVTSCEYPKWFYLLWLEQHLKKFQSIAAGKATTMGHIQRHHLSEAKCMVPNNDLLNTTNDIFECILAKQISNGKQSRSLIVLRDMLLPKLVSGELQVTLPTQEVRNDRN